MKVHELIHHLNNFDPDTDVILSRDPEGNGYGLLSCVDAGTYNPKEVYYRQIESYYSDEHTDDECGLEPGERDFFTQVVCLYP